MTLPAHRYLIWLFLRGMELPLVLEHLEELSLPRPSTEMLNEYRSIAENTPMSVMTKRRLARNEFLAQDQEIFKKLRLEEHYLKHCGKPLEGTNERAWQDTQALIANPVARVAVECCLAAGMKLEEIRQLVKHTHEIDFTDPGFELYQRVYFDCAAQNKRSWREYLKMLSRDPYSYVRFMAALTQSKDEVLHLVGLPTKPAFSNFLKKVLSKAEYKFGYLSGLGTGDGDDSARKWAKIGVIAGIQYEKFAAADVTDFSTTLQTEFEFIEDGIETVTGEMLSAVKPESLESAQGSKAPAAPVLSPDLEV